MRNIMDPADVGLEPTSCACSDCADHCHHQPGPLMPGDLQRILDFLKAEPSQRQAVAKQFFRASPGAVVMDRRPPHQIKVIPTITPTTVEGTSRCVFLADSGLCSIYPVAPYGCRYFDAHMDDGEQQLRAAFYLSQIDGNPAYTAERLALPEATGPDPAGERLRDQIRRQMIDLMREREK